MKPPKKESALANAWKEFVEWYGPGFNFCTDFEKSRMHLAFKHGYRARRFLKAKAERTPACSGKREEGKQ